MYCTGCGQQLVPDAKVCPRCGRPVGVAPVPVVYNRVHRHYQALWILWLVYAGWTALGYFIALPFLMGMTHGWFFYGHRPMMLGPFITEHIPWLWPMVTVVVLVRLILSVTAAIALMQRWPGARVLAIVAAVVALIRPILGTLLGIYTLWVLAPGLSGQEWDRMTQPPGIPPVRGPGTPPVQP